MGYAEPYCKCPAPEPVVRTVPVYTCPVCGKHRNDEIPIHFTKEQFLELWRMYPSVKDAVDNAIANGRPVVVPPLLEFLWPRIEWELRRAAIIAYVDGHSDCLHDPLAGKG